MEQSVSNQLAEIKDLIANLFRQIKEEPINAHVYLETTVREEDGRRKISCSMPPPPNYLTLEQLWNEKHEKSLNDLDVADRNHVFSRIGYKRRKKQVNWLATANPEVDEMSQKYEKTEAMNAFLENCLDEI